MLPRRHQVGVVLDQDGDAEPIGEVRADGVLVPARHARGRDDGAVGRVDRAGHADADPPHREPAAPRRDELLQPGHEPVERGPRPVPYVAGVLDDGQGRAAEVDQAEPGVVAAEVGPGEQPGPGGEPETPGTPAASGQPRALLLEQARVDQLLDAQRHARRGEARMPGEFRARLGMAQGDETEELTFA